MTAVWFALALTNISVMYVLGCSPFPCQLCAGLETTREGVGSRDGGILLAYQLTGRYGIGQKGKVPQLTVKVYGGWKYSSSALVSCRLYTPAGLPPGNGAPIPVE